MHPHLYTTLFALYHTPIHYIGSKTPHSHALHTPTHHTHTHQAGQNPSSWALDVTSGNIPGMPDFAEIFEKSELYENNCDLINQLSEPPPGSKPLEFKSAYASSLVCCWGWGWVRCMMMLDNGWRRCGCVT